MSRNGALFPLVLLILMLLISAVSWFAFQPPSPDSSPKKSDFSTEKAMRHVNFLAKEPHGGGSQRLAVLRDYLVDELQKLGFETKIQQDILSAKSYGFRRSLYVQNVIALKKGSGNKDKAIALMSHYDSQPHTPGAADDICGVAAILEAARALVARGHEHDLMLVITDGEEAGLVGAKAFVGSDPLAKEIGLLLNFEARGNKGVVSTFEIFGNVDWLIPEYAKALQHPFANSISYEVYKRLPNDTDFTITRKNEIPGFNMALIGGHAAYHSMIDTPENLDIGSLTHMGEYALNLASHFDKLDLSTAFPPEKNDIIFFNPAGFFFLYFPVEYLLYALIFCGVISILLIVLGIVRYQYGFFDLLKALLLWIVLIVLALGLSFLIAKILQIVNPEFSHFNMRGLYPLEFFALGFSFFLLALFGFFTSFYLKISKPFSLHLAGILLWLIFSILCYVFVRGASYLFIYPLLFASVGALIHVFLGFEHKSRRLVYGISAFIFAIPILLFLVPITSLLHDSFGIYMVVGPALITILLLILLFPLFEVILKSFGMSMSFLSLLVATLFFVGAKFYFAPSEQFPLQSSMIYLQDLDKNEAWWASEFAETDFWNEHYFKDKVELPVEEEWMQRMAIAAKAPKYAAAVPDFVISSDTIIQNHRQLTVDLSVEPEVAYIGFQLSGNQALGIEMPDMPVKDMGVFDYLQLVGLPDSRSIRLHFNAVKTPLQVTVYSQKIGLPKELLDKPMPPEVVPGTGYLSHIDILKKTFVIE